MNTLLLVEKLQEFIHFERPMNSNKYCCGCERLGEKSCFFKSVFIEEPLIKCDDGMSCYEKWGREWNEGGGRGRCYCNASRSVTFVYSITTSEALVQVF